jgi:DNA-binding protein
MDKAKKDLIGNNEGKNKLKSIDDKIDDQMKMLQDSLRTLNETTEVANSVTKELEKSDVKIKNARCKTEEINGNTDMARRSLGNIKKRSGFIGFINIFNPFK